MFWKFIDAAFMKAVKKKLTYTDSSISMLIIRLVEKNKQQNNHTETISSMPTSKRKRETFFVKYVVTNRNMLFV